MTDWTRSTDFQRSFLACSYFFGTRGEALTGALGAVALGPAAAELVRGLRSSERSERARALARELGRLSSALDEGGLSRC